MKRRYLLVISLALVALLGLAACVPTWGQPQPYYPSGPQGPYQQPQQGQTYPYGGGGMMGPGGMMGGGMMGGGMMGGGMMGGGMMGGGMMGGHGGYNPNLEAITIDDAAEAVERYLHAFYGENLALAEVMEFAWNFYAEVEEETTGIHAMELTIDKYTGQVSPEMGPNMMWNTKYGMMGSLYGEPTADMPISAEQAQTLAQQFLDTSLPGVTAGEAETFYGYYTLHTLSNAQIEGMLSVNGYTGEVWYHTWHGPFIQMAEFEH